MIDPKAIDKIVQAARQFDREMLDEVSVHVCDTNNDNVRRQQLRRDALALSQAIADAGLTIPGSNLFDVT